MHSDFPARPEATSSSSSATQGVKPDQGGSALGSEWSIASPDTHHGWESGPLTSLLGMVREAIQVFDLTGVCHFANDAFGALVLMSPALLIGKRAMDLAGLAPAMTELWTLVESTLIEWRTSETSRSSRRGPSGFTLSPVLDSTGRVSHLALLRRSDAPMQQVQEAQHWGEEHFQTLVQHLRDSFWMADPGFERLLYVSPSLERLWQRPAAQFLQDASLFFRPIHGEDRARLKALHGRTLEGPREDTFRFLMDDGPPRMFRVRVSPLSAPDGSLSRWAGVAEELAPMTAREEGPGWFDPLTGLLNRAAFLERLMRQREVQRLDPDAQLSLLHLDLDRFSVINEGLGQAAGDEVLRQVSVRLKGVVRAVDVLARLGDDDFVILLHGGERSAEMVAQRILSALEEPIQVRGEPLAVTTSIGIAVSSGGWERTDELLQNAGLAMHASRALGGNCFQTFRPDRARPELEARKLDLQLRRALERDELRVHYQPVVDLRTGSIVGFEALVRWQHPERGLLGPGMFVPLAEASGLIVPMGEWVLRASCRQLHHWVERFGADRTLFVNVNVSPRQFVQESLHVRVSQILQEEGVSPGMVNLELTESLLVESAAHAATMMEQLQALGVQFAIDDFGTGYASLAYLLRLPFGCLKLDRSFVHGVGDRGKQWEVVRAIVQLGQTLHLKVVAEGVEREQDLAVLCEMGCDLAQGFYFARPAPAEAAEALLEQGARWYW